MYAVIGLKRLILGFAALIIIIMLVMLAIERPSDLWEFGSVAWKVVSGAITAVLLLGSIPAVFQFFWRIYGKVVPGSYPDISGKWVGTIESNYAIHKVIDEAASSKDIVFNSQDPAQVANVELLSLPATMEVKASLLKISVVMNVQRLTDTSQSVSVCASPVVSTDGEYHGLAYIYKSRHHRSAPDDEASHTGAAEVQLINNIDDTLTMKGLYWTVRNWRRAGNTAGVLVFKRA